MSNTWFVIVMIALVFAGPAGQAFEWHWVNPLPQGNSIYGGWTSPDGEIFLVGEGGTVARGRDDAWNVIQLPGISSRLQAIHGTSSDNVFAVGYDGAIARWDGTVWRQMDSTTTANLDSVWALADGTVYVGGGIYPNLGFVLRWDGADWTHIPCEEFMGEIYDLWAAPDGAVFGAGSWSTFIRIDDGQITVLTPPPGDWELAGIWGFSSADIYVAGQDLLDDGMTLFHWDGELWTEIASVAGQMWGINGDLWGSSPHNIYIAGNNSVIYHWDGAVCATLETPSWTYINALVPLTGDSVLAAGEQGSMYSCAGNVVTPVSTGTTASIHCLWGFAADDIIFGTDGPDILQWNGEHLCPMPRTATAAVNGIWAFSRHELLAISFDADSETGMIEVWDGTQWKIAYNSTGFEPVSAAGLDNGEAVIAGRNGSLLRGKETDWSLMPNPGVDRIKEVTGRSYDNLYLITDPFRPPAQIWQWNGVDWTMVWSDAAVSLYDIWLAPDGVLLAAGLRREGTASYPLVLTWDGLEWREDVFTEYRGGFYDIFGATGTDYCVCGPSQRLFYHEVDGWRQEPLPCAGSVRRCWEFDSGEALVARGTSIMLKTEAPEAPTPTPVPTPQFTPTPDVTPEPECHALGVELSMPAHYFSPGDPCGLVAEICNPGLPLPATLLVAVLDVGGHYFFYPSWREYSGADIDYEVLAEVGSGLTSRTLIPAFMWPTGAGAADDLAFFAALIHSDTAVLVGTMGSWTFGFGA